MDVVAGEERGARMSIRTYISPHGRVVCEESEAATVEPAVALSEPTERAIRAAFDVSSAEGLLLLGGQTIREPLPADLLFWREFGRRFFQSLCQLNQEQLEAFASLQSAGRRSSKPAPSP